MGTYQATDIHVTIPADSIKPLAEALRDRIRAEQYSDNFGMDWTDGQLVGQWLQLSEGDEGQLYDEQSYVTQSNGDIIIIGGFYGKVSGDVEEVEALYAEHGAYGIVDSMCEDSPMRVRFTKDGRVLRIGGVIEYPGDEDDL